MTEQAGMGVGWVRDFKREGIYVYLGLIHIIVWQKPRKHCKAIILQLKTDFKKFEKRQKKKKEEEELHFSWESSMPYSILYPKLDM